MFYDLGNSNLCISGITRPIELKFGVHLNRSVPFFDIVFIQIDSWIVILCLFRKMIAAALVAENCKRDRVK